MMTDRAHPPDPTDPARARIGQTLKGKWRLDRLIGVGGMAVVYAGTHRNNKRVAIKMLLPELSANVAVRERFLREGYVANTVGHPGALIVDDDDVADDGCAFLVMELLEGETLETRWTRNGQRLAVDEAMAAMDQVLDTLSAAHAKGIVHRDLKPENLFLTRSGAIKILDFGIARLREMGSSATKTQTGSTMGTPAFMPPEQARGLWSDVDERTDIWAIGATLFTLMTGRYVHEARTVNEALILSATQPVAPLASVLPGVSRGVAELVDRALRFERAERWENAHEMQQALRRAFEELGGADLPSSRNATAGVGSTLVSSVASAPDPSPAVTDDRESAPVRRSETLTTARGVTTSGPTGAPKLELFRIVPRSAWIGLTALAVLGLVAALATARRSTQQQETAVSAAPVMTPSVARSATQVAPVASNTPSTAPEESSAIPVLAVAALPVASADPKASRRTRPTPAASPSGATHTTSRPPASLPSSPSQPFNPLTSRH